jgi:hypothetical protein
MRSAACIPVAPSSTNASASVSQDLVVETAAVRPVRAQGGEEVAQCAGGVGVTAGRPADGLLEQADLGVLIQIRLSRTAHRCACREGRARVRRRSRIRSAPGTYAVTCALASSAPAPMRVPATAVVSDLLTDISRCSTLGTSCRRTARP